MYHNNTNIFTLTGITVTQTADTKLPIYLTGFTIAQTAQITKLLIYPDRYHNNTDGIKHQDIYLP